MVVVGRYDKSYGVGVGVKVSEEIVDEYAYDYVEGVNRNNDSVEYYRYLSLDDLLEEDCEECEKIATLIKELEEQGYEITDDDIKLVNYPESDEKDNIKDSWVMIVLLPVQTNEKFQYEMEVDGYLVGSKLPEQVEDKQIKEVIKVFEEAGFTPFKVYEFMY